MMDVATLQLLLAPAGQDLLRTAGALAPTEATYLRCFDRLAKLHPRELVRATLDTLLLRQRAASKFAHAERMYFERVALEQASGTATATHRAARLAGLRVAELGCGLGGDTLALAAVAQHVVASDRAELRLALAQANVAACGGAERVHWVPELPAAACATADVLYCDPDRRTPGTRVLGLDAGQPPLHELRQLAPRGLVVKAAPGVPLHELAGLDAEVEFVSVRGELKECVLWFGPLRTTGRRASVLPGPHTLHAAEPTELPPSAPPGAVLYDPDPAVARSGMLGALAEQLHAWPLDSTGAYLSADRATATPFASAYHVEAWLPFNVPRLRAALRERQVGQVMILKRNAPIDVQTLPRELKLHGDQQRFVALTRHAGKTIALIAHRVDAD